MLKKLTSWLGGKHQHTQRKRSVLGLERLDERVVPSCVTKLNGFGQLSIAGTPGHDVVQVRQVEDKIRVEHNGKTDDFSAAKVRSIDFRGAAGDDQFTNSTNLRSTARGGSGKDTLVGGNSSDSLFGDAGDDSMLGGGGNDRMHGGQGRDDLQGGSGNDDLNGEQDDDRLSGGDGNDTERGGHGRDDISGGNGDDRLFGDAGDDRSRGDSGRDFVSGGAGHDQSVRDSDDRFDDSDRDEGVRVADGIAKIEGKITAVGADNVQITTSRGVALTVSVNASTKIERNGVHVPLSALQVGDPGEAKFNPETMVAFKVEAGSDHEDMDDIVRAADNAKPGKVEGQIIDLTADTATILVSGGRSVTVKVIATTKLERNDLHVAFSAFKVGDQAQALFNPISFEASKFEAVGA